ncbi:Uncharacterised protein [Shigella sonnei]|nr:Uncharacterised protein [Shigella sonnei]CSF30034.1 Uncharacterised protein [Shigella sonnei]CSG34981.1 Uncharacterised protein [Shigella sonnei]CSP11847.1 Uncharacterised protein [Shigella sonnei]
MNKQTIQRALNHFRRGLSAQLAAFQTQSCVIQQILRAGAAFRVLTPAAAQRTAFKKYDRADTGAIMGRVALNIENHSRLSVSFKH